MLSFLWFTEPLHALNRPFRNSNKVFRIERTTIPDSCEATAVTSVKDSMSMFYFLGCSWASEPGSGKFQWRDSADWPTLEVTFVFISLTVRGQLFLSCVPTIVYVHMYLKVDGMCGPNKIIYI